MRHLFLSLYVSLSSPSKNTQPTPLGNHQPPSTQCHHPLNVTIQVATNPQPITKSINHGTPKKDFTPSKNTAQPTTTNHQINQPTPVSQSHPNQLTPTNIKPLEAAETHPQPRSNSMTQI